MSFRLSLDVVFLLVAILAALPLSAARAAESSVPPRGGFRGVFFNPNIEHAGSAGYPWPVFAPYDPAYRAKMREAVQDLVRQANLNFIDMFVPIPFTLAHPPKAPAVNQPIEQWANLTYLDNLAHFVDDCYELGVAVELDPVDNRWLPYSIDSEHHLGKPGQSSWPVADDTPWDESATWYSQVIEYVEAHAKHPENIAMWSMMGHYGLGAAEPAVWDNEMPGFMKATEKFVKTVWPAFRAAGKRPKASPIMNPIFSNDPYWMAKTPEARLSGFSNLKRWLVDDLHMPPDYWVMSTYPYCDPAPDGFHYLRRIVEILGKENAARIVSTDLKGPGHDHELVASIIGKDRGSGAEMLQWHFDKCKEYGFGGWWIWSYQDPAKPGSPPTGLRDRDGQWKPDLLAVVIRQAQTSGN